MQSSSGATRSPLTRGRVLATTINGLLAGLIIWSVARVAALGDSGQRALAAFWYIPIDAVICGAAFAAVAVAHAIGWRQRWRLQIGAVTVALILPAIVFAGWIASARP